MSLQVWLPLNGNLNNQGLNSVKIINNGATIDNNGKIGKCYSFNGNDNYIEIENISYIFAGQTQPFSLALWIYWAENGSRGVVFSSYGNPNTSTNYFAFEINSGSVTNNTLRFHWNGADLSYGGIVVPNNWTHIACTYDGKEVKKYINGVLAKTITGALPINTGTEKYRLGRDSRTGTTAFNGKMNDVRIYDHCLSEKEVREIASGLLIHYKLSGTGQDNLLTNSKGEFSGAVPASSYTDFKSWGGFTVNANEVYTLSYEGKATKDGVILVNHFYNNSSGIVQCAKSEASTGYSGTGRDGYCIVPLTTEYQKYWVRWTFDSTTTSATKTILFRCSDNNNSGETVTVKNVKLERGSIATPWCPNSSDAQYTSLGYNSSVEYDSSGYGYNGTKVGKFELADSGGRNTSAYKFNANSYIICHPDCRPTDAITVSWWGYLANWANYDRAVSCTESGGWNFEWYSGKMNFALYQKDVGYFTPPMTNVSLNSLSPGWHHWVGTYAKGVIKLYLDGELVETNTSSNTTNGIAYHPTAGLFLGAEAMSSPTVPDPGRFNGGRMSDFRIYATALAAEDIKNLYNNGITVDSYENVWAYELVEG